MVRFVVELVGGVLKEWQIRAVKCTAQNTAQHTQHTQHTQHSTHLVVYRGHGLIRGPASRQHHLVGVWMDGCMDGWVYGWMGGWTNYTKLSPRSSPPIPHPPTRPPAARLRPPTRGTHGEDGLLGAVLGNQARGAAGHCEHDDEGSAQLLGRAHRGGGERLGLCECRLGCVGWGVSVG